MCLHTHHEHGLHIAHEKIFWVDNLIPMLYFYFLIKSQHENIITFYQHNKKNTLLFKIILNILFLVMLMCLLGSMCITHIYMYVSMNTLEFLPREARRGHQFP